jgi:hypothetical protein
VEQPARNECQVGRTDAIVVEYTFLREREQAPQFMTSPRYQNVNDKKSGKFGFFEKVI